MGRGIFAQRYGKALFNAAAENNSLEKVRKETNVLCDIFSSELQIASFFTHPAIPIDVKLEAVNDAFSRILGQTTISFLKILIEQKRMSHLVDAIKIFDREFQKKQNIANVIVTTRFPITGDLKENLIKSMGSYLNQKVEIEERLDAKIIGGIRISIDDKVIDGTVVEGLQRMRRVLTAK